MVPEKKAAQIVWRMMAPTVSFEDFERHLTSQRRPEWNQAVSMIADAIREYAMEQFEECSTELDALAQVFERKFTGLEMTLALAQEAT
jgi:hypothetical protein